ncbi:YjbH domain-containing protein [Xinfangfangia sp. CPCC 101601]|uniref:YjbH domain-containing protein n=1 Tax=Pseudogemmobacter lacusdianii TaxID=3069608 RepID=A0ABU0VTU4_9RHOB|nr:YjbH domain-containing protein [Xinfangfangia sp. CPCC 101601]MDQ2065141.1 YjbH domain-containing protein [Xinfangfangia sp. CPCC 101601]
MNHPTARRVIALIAGLSFLSSLTVSLWGGVAPARAEMRPSLSFNGVPGVIDMPSGEAMKDGMVAITASTFGGQLRSTLTFQITPRISGSYRFSNTRNWNDALLPGDPLNDGYDSYSDRAFDLRFLVLEETAHLPALSIGLQDFVGTGKNSAEYIVATKNFGERLKVTAGLGWGRLSSYNDIGATGRRPPIDMGVSGGKPSAEQWFRGPFAPFAGVEWQINSNWSVKAEYSSDAYDEVAGARKVFDRASPFNFGLEYRYADSTRLGIYSLYGSEIGFNIQLTLDPKERASGGILGPAPMAVGLRPSRSADPEAWDQGWIAQTGAAETLRSNLSKYLAADGLIVEDFSYTATKVHLRVRNTQIDSGPQAIGRAARALSRVMPASVEVFEIVPVVRGMGASQVTLRRSDLEVLEHSPANDLALRQRVVISDAGPVSQGIGDKSYKRFKWGLAPALRISEPFHGDLGLRASASYEIRPGLVFSGAVFQRLAGNFDACEFCKPSLLPPVRSDGAAYNLGSDTSLDRLQLAWYGKAAPNLYARATVGYLERMHAGLSTELLWKPVDSRLALGVEVNYTKQRDTDGFGFGDYDYAVATGHVSAYYDLGGGYLGQLDVGRYLAGDTGATLSLDREFANGIKLGAYATLTSASAAEFGEGSFDKGIRLTVPINWLLGRPDRREFSATMRALQRDGGARLEVDGRLYDTVRDYHLGVMDRQWGRVWR